MYSSVKTAQKIFTVSQLNRQVAELLDQQLGRLWVEGEISNVTPASSGHWYFTIKDERATVKAVMFRGRATRVGFVPKVGGRYRFYAAVTLYEPRGDYQLQVEAMESFGVGDLHAEFERLKNKLAAEGLFDVANKRDLLRVPKRVGVVTSLTAAALRDVLSTMRRRSPHVEVYVYPAAVQGVEAAQQLCQALGQAIAAAEVQTILLVRGGGSMEDLWSFNDEHLARLIKASPIPVISGIGHETDFTIADFVADVRAPTPTAAAELCCDSHIQSNADLLGLLRRLQQSQARIVERAILRLDRAVAQLTSPQQRIKHARQRLGYLSHRLQRCLPNTGQAQQQLAALQQRLMQSNQRLLQTKKQNLFLAQQTLAALNPEAVLDRGYAIVRNESGDIIKSALAVAVNESLQIQLAQGHLLVKLTKKHDLL